MPLSEGGERWVGKGEGGVQMVECDETEVVKMKKIDDSLAI